MPRIRTVKPEFWSDEKLAPLPPLTRLVFLGLISMADDAGRLVDNVKAIDGFIFPETDDTCREELSTLASLSRISRYCVASSQRVIQIVNWPKHQKVDRPSPYVLPAEDSRDTRESLDNSSRSDLGPRTVDHGPRTVDRGPADARAGKAKADSNGAPPSPTADAAWEDLVAMVPRWQRREFTATDHAGLPDGAKRGLSAIGGFPVIVATPADKMVWLKKEFVAAYNAKP